MHLSPAFTAASASAALLGGLLLGLLCACRRAGTGENLSSATPCSTTPGVVIGGVLLSFAAPAAFEVFSAEFNYARTIVGAALIGAGATLGQVRVDVSPSERLCAMYIQGHAHEPPHPTSTSHLTLHISRSTRALPSPTPPKKGCTCGNGIQGMASFSLASLVFVVVFMVAGAVAASASGAGAMLPTSAADPAAVGGGVSAVPWAAVVLAVLGIAAQMLMVKGGKKNGSATRTFADVFAGLSFAACLAVSGMVKPSKVVGFLDAFNTEHGWDPTLAFVMGGALISAKAGYVILRPVAKEGVVAWAARPVTLRLIIGGVLFGCGWGVSGMCPGPAMVVAGALFPSHKAVLFVVTMFGVRPFAARIADRVLG